MGFEELLTFASNNIFAIFVAVYLLWDKTKSTEKYAETTKLYIETLEKLKSSIESMEETNKSLYNIVHMALFENHAQAGQTKEDDM